MKTVAQQLFHDRLHICQSLQAVAQVPGRRHAQVVAEHAGAAAVVRHGDHGGDIVRVVFQAPQHGGKAGAAANGYDMRAAAGRNAAQFLFHLTYAPG